MLVFLDIETIPDLADGALQRCIDTVEPPGNYKKPESIAEWKAANAATIGAEQWQRTALDPMCGSIIVIGWSPVEKETRAVSRDPNNPNTERLLLEEWADAIRADLYVGGPLLPRFVGWNLSDFDLRFLAIRCAVHKINLPFRIPVNAKLDGVHMCDLMKVWAGYKGYQKQSSVAKCLGIPLEDETDGSQLWELVQKEGIDAAVRKCKSDINVLREIYARMKPIFGC